MKKWCLIVTLLGLSACSSSQPASYYQLPQPLPVLAVTAQPAAQNQLWVEQVSIPDYLAGNGIVYQTSEVQYTIATSNLWASPLEQQLKNSLVTNLSSALPGWVVATSPLGNQQQTLNVNVTGFHGRYDGKVVVAGEWLLTRQGQISRHPFYLTLDQKGDGYSALVKSLGIAWQQVSSQIAAGITAN